ncbi:MAG TPA: winged helix-turn-helix domain-containing protein [Aliidongia sp.]|nr:winged helix-turn-helix domain-containing protein [Aliidongia sp.]
MTKKQDHVFGGYRLQPGSGLFVENGAVALSGKALDILTVLVEAGGDLVTKNELLEQVWPGLTVEEHNIQVHISTLRKALGNEAGWIVTVPKRGYRFAGPVGERPAAASPSSLPQSLGRLFGREEDLVTIRSLFDRSRLVTIVGTGGIGKTRLGLEFAREIGNAVFIDLSVLQDPSLVPSLVATALGIELKGDGPDAQLARRLRGQELLILLDNCEHVLDAVATLVEQILADAPPVRLLATSREPLACLGEQVYRLPPLPVPTDEPHSPAEALASAAVALLVDRLKAADVYFELTEAAASAASIICRRLDGLPLAIEMVGALAPSLGLETMAVRLEKSFSLPYSVTRTIVPRHRSLEATLDWSYALLSPEEQVALRRLSVFPGPFSLDAVEAVLGDGGPAIQAFGNVLIGLVRKSLVSIDPGAAVPYRLLETIRAYAAEKLDEAGERELLHARHARYVADRLMEGLEAWDATGDAIWRDRYGWLLADLRTALDWSFGMEGDTNIGLAIVGRAGPLWSVLNLRDGRRWVEAAVAVLDDSTPDLIAAHVWMAFGFLISERSIERAIAALRKAADLFERLNAPKDRASALAGLGQLLAMSGDTEGAKEALAAVRVLLPQNSPSRRLGVCLLSFSILYTAEEAWSDARRECALALNMFEGVGATKMVMGTQYELADLLWTEGTLAPAIDAAVKVLDMARRHGNRRYIGHSAGILSGMFTTQGDVEQALVFAREAVPLCREDDYVDWLFPHLALRAAKAGRPDDAARLLGYVSSGIETGAFQQFSSKRALASLDTLLRDALTADRMEQLVETGRHLNEDQAVALALG